MTTNFKGLVGFNSSFASEENCRRYFEAIRFKDGDFCPHCGHDRILRFSDGVRYRCRECRRDFTIKTGTIFGESKLPIQKWFIAIYLLTTRKKGISSVELAEQCEVTQKTAWFMDHRIREAMGQGYDKLFGVVETDETLTGGLEKNKHANRRTPHAQGRSTATKTPVMGMVQRGGKVRATVVPDVKTDTVERNLIRNVRRGSAIYTDDFISYRNLKRHFRHEVVCHAKGEYARGEVHSNSTESFWALFKRGYHGTYHSISRKHLQRYLDEFTFRLNTRTAKMGERFMEVVQEIANRGKLSYDALIERKVPLSTLAPAYCYGTRYEKRQAPKEA